jgi:hypothetical protein
VGRISQGRRRRAPGAPGPRAQTLPCDSLDPVSDGADAGLYAALNAAYGGALEYNGTISNINTQVLDEMADAVAHAVLLFAMSTGSVNGAGQAADQAAIATGDRLGAHFRR